MYGVDEQNFQAGAVHVRRIKYGQIRVHAHEYVVAAPDGKTGQSEQSVRDDVGLEGEEHG